ncbi:Cell division cycle protein 20-like [Papilio machaon]|uniref:Cell division cycle protein 20-like n=1 Tax=Papilio machaon TaxID=76193 RepID=A0A194RA82_PAPMA|nr:Cell division cycle protein 20-like [Papilio machaon]
MAQFNYLNEINSLATMDGPITRGPLQRWIKKSNNENINPSLSSSLKNISNANISSCNQSLQKLSITANQSCNNSALSNSKTPTRNENKKGKKTPCKTKSPGRSTTPTPNKASKTPNKADRFIPSRSNSNYDLCHYMMSRDEEKSEEAVSQIAASEAIGRVLTDTEPGRLLQYTCKAPAAPEGYQNRLRVVYSQAKVPSTVKNNTRYIPQAPERILDAPDILDDYYLNLVDWSPSNVVAVALGNAVYLWNAGTGQIDQLLTLEGSETVSSVSWVQGGSPHLAVGTSSSTVELWDCSKIKRLRLMDGHSGRVGALAWNMYILSSGGRDGNIVHHDVRQRDHALATVYAHTREVCALKWSLDGKYLASGGNDNLLNIWPLAEGQHYSQPQYLYSFNQHLAAVKGLAWCPWSAGVLASGGGTADRTIRIWNVSTGTNLNTVDTKSQVCALKWSLDGKYLASGGNDNLLNIWPLAEGQHYSQPQYLYSFNQHLAAVKGLAWCPWSAGVLASGGGTADRTIRIWNVSTGTNLNTVDTKSQVCSIVWSTHYKELISGHGYANNQLIIWKYPTMTRVAELSGHVARVLHLALSPDGTSVLSAGADETLRLWKCFMLDPSKKKGPTDSKAAKSLLNMNSLIR